MKTIKFARPAMFAILFILAAGLSSFSANPRLLAAPADVRAKLDNKIAFPADLRPDNCEGCVDVIFVVEEGEIIIESAVAENKELSDYVKKELKKVCCKDLVTPTNQHYSVRFSFKLI